VKRDTKRDSTPLGDTFGAVRAMIAAHAPPLNVRRDAAADYAVTAAHPGHDGEPFARLHRGATAVTLELPGLERDPNLMLKVGTALAACRGGTSDFTFTAPNSRVFEDIARLLAICVAPYTPAKRRS
jgi:hypothetical protein